MALNDALRRALCAPRPRLRSMGLGNPKIRQPFAMGHGNRSLRRHRDVFPDDLPVVLCQQPIQFRLCRPNSRYMGRFGRVGTHRHLQRLDLRRIADGFFASPCATAPNRPRRRLPIPQKIDHRSASVFGLCRHLCTDPNASDRCDASGSPKTLDRHGRGRYRHLGKRRP